VHRDLRGKRMKRGHTSVDRGGGKERTGHHTPAGKGIVVGVGLQARCVRNIGSDRLASGGPPIAEELFEQLSARGRPHSANYLDSVIEAWMPHHVADASTHPRLVVVGAEHEPAHL